MQVCTELHIGKFRYEMPEQVGDAFRIGHANGICQRDDADVHRHQFVHLGYVDARLNPDANAIAREVADNASADFDCTREQAWYYGLDGNDAEE